MDRWLHVVLFVALGSLLGLAHPMVLVGPGILASVWAASLPGDLVFVAGMAATYLLARRAPGWTAVPAGLVLTWITYSVAWSITGTAMDFDDAAGDHASVWVLRWGWAGLLYCGFWPWVQRTLEEKAVKADAIPEHQPL